MMMHSAAFQSVVWSGLNVRSVATGRLDAPQSPRQSQKATPRPSRDPRLDAGRLSSVLFNNGYRWTNAMVRSVAFPVARDNTTLDFDPENLKFSLVLWAGASCRI